VRRWTASAIAFAVMGCLAFGLPAAAHAAAPPSEVVTEPAEAIPGGAKLKGELNPGGLPTTYYFMYARDTCDEGCTPSKTAKSGPLTGDTQQEVPAVELTGLSGSGGSERYWYILVASNAEGTVYGGLVNFTPGAPLPLIEDESVSHVTSTDATLEAQIDVEGLKHGADYQFQIVENPSEYASELICPSTRPQGHEICVGPQSPGVAPIGFVPSDEAGPLKSSPVSLDLAGAGITLKPGTTYHYRVLAARSVQTEDTIQWEGPTVYGPDQTFTTPPAGIAPVIESVSLSHLTSTDATLEAKIDTEGRSTLYQFELRINLCPYSECVGYEDIPLPSGLLLGSFVGQAVSLDLNSVGASLAPGVYEYALSATSSGGHVESQWQTLIPAVLDPPGPGASTQSGAGPPAASSEGGQPAGSGGADQPASSGGSSSTSGMGVLGAQTGKASEPKPLKNAQKLAKALKACAKRPKNQRAKCERQARKQYPTTASKARKPR